MRNPRRHQANGRQLVRLRQLRLQFNALRNVVDDDEATFHAEISSHQRRDRNVDSASFPRRRVESELVQIVYARVLPNVMELLHERRRHHFAQ